MGRNGISQIEDEQWLHGYGGGLSPTTSRQRVRSHIRYTLEALIILVAIAIGVVLHYGYYQSAIVVLGSMSPTLNDGERVLVSKFAYWHSPPKRGDIVLLRDPTMPNQRSEYLIKRVVGLPGEEIFLWGGIVFVNRLPLEESYIPPKSRRKNIGYWGPYYIDEGEVFVLGDQRESSYDSRDFGCVPLDLIMGKVVWRYYPLSRWGRVQ